MLNLAIFIFVVLLLLLLIGLLKLNILVEYKRNGIDDVLVISLYTLKGILKYKYELPFLDAKKEGLTYKKVKEKGKKEKDVQKEKKEFSFEEMVDRFKRYKGYYKENKKAFKKAKKYIEEKMVINEVDIEMVFGTGDAFYTGILNGYAWSAAGILMSYLLSHFSVVKKKVDIRANFNKKMFKFDFYCIFHLRVVHIIGIGMQFLLNYLKRRWFKWRNIQFKAL